MVRSIRPTQRKAVTWALVTSSIVALAAPAHAQDSVTSATAPLEAQDIPEEDDGGIVITGSRIRRTDTTTSAPVTVIDAQVIEDRGFVQVGEALNQSTSIDASVPQSAGSGGSSGNGRQYPALFGLGSARTLSLVNGRRFVSTGSGLGAPTVDTNLIPTGLLRRVEIVEAGGAAVYGSDAIAGVVNYVLNDSYEGAELDFQSGITERGDYPTLSFRGTAGTNFDEGRGNVAFSVNWSKTKPLANSARPATDLARVTVTNFNDTGPNDGIPSVVELFDARFWEFNRNGVVFSVPNPTLGANGLVRIGGQPIQFDTNGMPIPYNPGAITTNPFNGQAIPPFASGGQGVRYNELGGLYTGVERVSANLIGHYDLSDAVTFRTELLYGRTESRDLGSFESRTVLGSAAAGTGYIQFNRNNGFLTPEAIAALSAAQPSFGFGAPMFLSKVFYDLVPDNESRTKTQVYRGVAALDGKFDAGGRKFYWSASMSYGRNESQGYSWGVDRTRYNLAINAVRNGAGEVVCAVNADASTANDVPACAPINPFGDGNVSEAARNYISVPTGSRYENEQYDALATLGGEIVRLPGGVAQFSVAYEHRAEKVLFTPSLAAQQGLVGSGTISPIQGGKYNTDELSGEVLIPLVGGDFTLPLVESLELTGAYRYVDNSIAGTESVWSVGGRWTVGAGVTLRASRSRNFRAPTLNELYAPASSGLGAISVDPCDADRINAGPNPSARRANCLALFEANPTYGVYPDGTGTGLSAADRLAGFQDPAENFAVATISSGGNPDLRNEISDTLTYGLVFSPDYIPGLVFTADRIEVDLQDGLSSFTTQNFLATCFDSTSPSPEVCGMFTRLAAPSGTHPAGTVITGSTTTFNAGRIRFEGEKYNLSYRFGLASLFGGGDIGQLSLGVEATHTSRLETSVTGFDFTRSDGTESQPDWVARFDVGYSYDGFRISYQLSYLPSTIRTRDSSIENNPNPYLDANYQHSVSFTYDMGNYSFRAGVTNLTDEQPSYPSSSYGDILGRRFYVGAKIKL